jgi:hypothetical protein
MKVSLGQGENPRVSFISKKLLILN